MGMFDEVKCERRLPLEKWQDTVFQTKDASSNGRSGSLDKILITKEGEFLRFPVSEAPERPSEGGSWNGLLHDWSMRDHFHFEPWTGEMFFYEYTAQRAWVEFGASFFEGHLTKEPWLVHGDSC